MKIVDCFTFYNELQLLNYRLEVLNDCVDYFVLVEAKHTHVGNPKQLFFENNKQKYSNFLDKIIHVVVDDMPYVQPNVDISKGEQWINEHFQRDCISRGLEKLNLIDEDILIVSDLDEIPDPNTLIRIKNNEVVVFSINHLQQDFYYYNLNSKFAMKWWLSKILNYKYLVDSKKSCNDIRDTITSPIPDGGWHLSYFGDANFIQNKLLNFGHQENNIDKFTDISQITKRMTTTTDLFDRHGDGLHTVSISENKYLPPKYEIFLTNFYS